LLVISYFFYLVIVVLAPELILKYMRMLGARIDLMKVGRHNEIEFSKIPVELQKMLRSMVAVSREVVVKEQLQAGKIKEIGAVVNKLGKLSGNSRWCIIGLYDYKIAFASNSFVEYYGIKLKKISGINIFSLFTENSIKEVVRLKYIDDDKYPCTISNLSNEMVQCDSYLFTDGNSKGSKLLLYFK